MCQSDIDNDIKKKNLQTEETGLGDDLDVNSQAPESVNIALNTHIRANDLIVKLARGLNRKSTKNIIHELNILAANAFFAEASIISEFKSKNDLLLRTLSFNYKNLIVDNFDFNINTEFREKLISDRSFWAFNNGNVPFLNEDKIECIGVKSTILAPILNMEGELIGIFVLLFTKEELGFDVNDTSFETALKILSDRIAVEMDNDEELRKNIENEKNLTNLIDNLPLDIWAVDSELIYTHRNNQYAKVYGEVTNLHFDKVKSNQDYNSKRKANINRALKGESINDELSFVLGDSKSYINEILVPITNNDEIIGVIGVDIDITKNKIAAMKLHASQRRLDLVLTNTPLAVIEFSIDSKVLNWNNAAEIIFGYSKEEAIGKSFFDLIVAKNFAQEISKVWENLVLAKTDTHKINENITKDGRTIVCEWFNSIVTDADDNVVSIVSLGNDITEAKLQETIIKKQVRELEKKNDELEKFTYTVSHDLKSPLITIKGFLGALKSDIEKNRMDRFEKDLDRIGKAADKMQILLDDLLELSRIGRITQPSTLFSMSDAAMEALDALTGRIEESKINISVQSAMPVVLADKLRIVEIFQNLIENSIKYMGENDNPVIEIGYLVYDKRVTYFVKDNGIGIDILYLEKVFGFFEKLNPNSEGSGIGLALVKRIVELYSGNIWVESEGFGKGCTFYFTIGDINNK